MFWRFLIILPGIVLIFWISSLFHGSTAFLICLLLLNCLEKICKVLFVQPAFNKYSDFQTLGLSS